MPPPKNFPKQSPALLYGAAIAVGLVLAVGLYLLVNAGDRPLSPRSSGQALIGGAFELVDDDGQVVTDQSFAGKPMLLYFGYTSCPDVCPIDLSKLARALKLMGDDARDLQPLFITIDPERDDPATIKEYLSRISPRLKGLTGTQEQIAVIAEAYKVYYAKSNSDGDVLTEDIAPGEDYWMSHSNIFYLMDGNGNFIRHFDANVTPEAMAQMLSESLKG